LSRALWDEDWIDPNPWVGRARERVAELAARAGWQDAAAFRQLGSLLANELGQMRVRMPPGHIEPTPYRDDHSWLWQHEATSEQALAMDASEVQADRQAGASEADMQAANPAITRHPEWDHRIAHLKPAWASVHEYSPITVDSKTATARYPSLIDEHRPRQARRQPDGPALDLDACVRLRIDQAQDLPGDARVFQRHRARPQPFAVLVLMDLSNSMNATVHGTPLHDLARRAGLSLVRTARGLGGAAALHGFSSNTRHAVRYERLLDFATAIDARALAHLHAVPARHSTRLGAALRHATRGLLARPEPRRLLLVLTDGAPSDVDVVDARHLVEDARHAVQAARRAEVDVMCLATASEDGPAIARIFGRQAQAVRDMQRMPQRLQAMLVQALD
jgi:nitric oxide reductase activation protein